LQLKSAELLLSMTQTTASRLTSDWLRCSVVCIEPRAVTRSKLLKPASALQREALEYVRSTDGQATIADFVMHWERSAIGSGPSWWRWSWPRSTRGRAASA
jgi:hypothetical protein